MNTDTKSLPQAQTDAGYDPEEAWFHKHNQELLEAMKEKAAHGTDDEHDHGSCGGHDKKDGQGGCGGKCGGHDKKDGQGGCGGKCGGHDKKDGHGGCGGQGKKGGCGGCGGHDSQSTEARSCSI